MGGYAAVSANCSSMKCPPVESGPVYCTELSNVQENMLPPCPAGTTPVAPSSCSSSLLSYCTRPSCGPPLLLHGSLYSVQPPPPLPFSPYLSPPTPSCVEASPTRSLPPGGIPLVSWSTHVTPLLPPSSSSHEELPLSPPDAVTTLVCGCMELGL